jgi:hypothetical protein
MSSLLRTEAGGLPRGTRGLHRIDSRMNARSMGKDSSSSNVGTASVHGEIRFPEGYQETDTYQSRRLHPIQHTLPLVHRGGEQQPSGQCRMQVLPELRHEVNGRDRIKRHTVSTPAENKAPARNAISVSSRPKSISRARRNFTSDGPESGSF